MTAARKTKGMREDQFAILELGLARVELGEGARKEARERAIAARTVLEKYKSQPYARSLANQLIGDKPAR